MTERVRESRNQHTLQWHRTTLNKMWQKSKGDSSNSNIRNMYTECCSNIISTFPSSTPTGRKASVTASNTSATAIVTGM